jgi:hypothetical protein
MKQQLLGLTFLVAPVAGAQTALPMATASALGLKPGDDCPKCGGELVTTIHRFDSSGGAPDCAWLVCLDCNYETEPE